MGDTGTLQQNLVNKTEFRLQLVWVRAEKEAEEDRVVLVVGKR